MPTSRSSPRRDIRTIRPRPDVAAGLPVSLRLCGVRQAAGPPAGPPDDPRLLRRLHRVPRRTARPPARRDEGQGLLENTDVIITSDHGESFGDHGSFGHSYTVNLDEVGVPLVILSPATRGPRGGQPRQPARLAGDRGRPGWACRPIRHSRADPWRPTGVRHPVACPRRSRPPPSPSRPTRPRSRPTRRAASITRGSRCPWWPRGCITSGTAGGRAALRPDGRPVRAGQPHQAGLRPAGCGRLPEDAPEGADG